MSWRLIGSGTVFGRTLEADQTIAPADQKGRNFFFRRTASEQNHVVLGLAQFANRQFVDSAQEMRLVLDKSRKGGPREPANGDRSDRVGGEAVTRGSRHPQKIAGQRKSHDLPAAVGQQLVEPHDALEQIVERRRHLLLGEHRLAGREMDMAAQMLQLPQFGPVERRAEAELTYRAIDAGLLRLARPQPGKSSCATPGWAGLQPYRAPSLPIDCILTDRPDAG